jgi:hypothetical protein
LARLLEKIVARLADLAPRLATAASGPEADAGA